MQSKKLFTRNFTLLVFGQASSLFGNYILRLALSMAVLEKTGSAATFAALMSLAILPTILLTPFGGILADRLNRRNIMVTLDVLSGLTVLATMFFAPRADLVTVIGAVLVAFSVLGAFESPTVQACVPQMQEGDNIVKGNAVISQVSAIAGLVAPILGSVLYTTFGLFKILPVCAACFFLTAFLESFIRLPHTNHSKGESIVSIIRADLAISLQFIFKKEKAVLHMLLLAAGMNFLIVGIGIVGLPYLVRNVLGLSAAHYGIAEGLMGLAAIGGSIVAGMLVTKIKVGKLYYLLVWVGVAVFPIAAAFLLLKEPFALYIVLVACVCAIQALACVFSIFGLSVIQQKTPEHMLGKVMAYVFTISMCAQPLGQILYGFLFENFSHALAAVFFITGLVICVVGFMAKSPLGAMQQEQEAAEAMAAEAA